MLISENVPSVHETHETHLYKSRTDFSELKNQHQRCIANFSKNVQEVGAFPGGKAHEWVSLCPACKV